jgi:pyruvate/2-oxoglutarate dehydrogenase complex dihydrolipoamide acyltransferase (E2) component
MALIEIQVPDIGDFDEVAVIELLVKAGDVVKAEQSLMTVESDKASMEIPCSQAGVVKELKVKLGDKVKQGSVVLVLEGEATSTPPSSSPTPVCQLQHLYKHLQLHPLQSIFQTQVRTVAQSTLNAICWSWVQALAVTLLHFVQQIWA